MFKMEGNTSELLMRDSNEGPTEVRVPNRTEKTNVLPVVVTKSFSVIGDNEVNDSGH